MPTEGEPPRATARQWLWFVLMWAAGVALFGAAVFAIRAVMGRMLGG